MEGSQISNKSLNLLSFSQAHIFFPLKVKQQQIKRKTTAPAGKGSRVPCRQLGARKQFWDFSVFVAAVHCDKHVIKIISGALWAAEVALTAALTAAQGGHLNNVFFSN